MLILYIFVVLIPIALIIFLILKSKKSSWTGEIVGKKELDKEDFDTDKVEHMYKVIVKIDGDREKHIEVDRDSYEMWNIGDRLEKKSGEMWPEKV